jgi:hypothetical protein
MVDSDKGLRRRRRVSPICRQIAGGFAPRRIPVLLRHDLRLDGGEGLENAGDPVHHSARATLLRCQSVRRDGGDLFAATSEL